MRAARRRGAVARCVMDNFETWRRVSLDISSILQDWPHRPDDLTVRFVDGDDGRRKIQLRVDLGVLQMEIDGRPDGRRIHDAESWLDYHRQRPRHGTTTTPIRTDSPTCSSPTTARSCSVKRCSMTTAT